MRNQLMFFAKTILERFPTLALTCRQVRDNWRHYEKPQETPMGFMFAGNKTMQIGQFEPEETQIAKTIFQNVDLVINIGANAGYYACIALSQGKHVLAFEPMPLTIPCLLRNIRANHWDSRIEVYPIALSNKVGVIEIYGSASGASLVKGWAGTPEYYVTLVPTSTMDNVLGARIQKKKCFFIVDIEGAEQWMLEGATSVIQMDPKPIWMMEIAITDHQPKGTLINPNLLSTFQLFWDNGYEAWTADKRCRLVRQDEITEIAKSGRDTLLIYNFLFIEKGKKHAFLHADHDVLP